MSWIFRLLLTLASISVLRPAGADEKPVFRAIAPDSATSQSGAILVRGMDLVQTCQVFPREQVASTAATQAGMLLHRLEIILKGAGTDLSKAVRLNVYLEDSAHVSQVRGVLSQYVDPAAPPAVTWVTTALPGDHDLVAMDALAAAPARATDIVSSREAGFGTFVAVLPAAATSRAYISGQAEKAATAAEGTRLTMASLLRTLEFLELAKSDVVHVKAFVAPINAAEDVRREIDAAFKPAVAPPVSLVEWESKDYPVEIELVAATTKPLPAGDRRPSLEFLTPPGMTTPTVYCRVARVQHPATIFLSGLYGDQADPNGEAELRQLFDRTQELAEGAGSDMRHLVKATYYVSAPGSSQQHNRLRPEYYDPLRPPAASKALVAGVGRPGRTITWDMIAIPKTP